MVQYRHLVLPPEELLASPAAAVPGVLTPAHFARLAFYLDASFTDAGSLRSMEDGSEHSRVINEELTQMGQILDGLLPSVPC